MKRVSLISICTLLFLCLSYSCNSTNSTNERTSSDTIVAQTILIDSVIAQERDNVQGINKGFHTWDTVHCKKIFLFDDDYGHCTTEQTFLFPTNDSILYRLNAQRVFGDKLPNVSPDSLVVLHSWGYIPSELDKEQVKEIKEVDSLSSLKKKWSSNDYRICFEENNHLLYQDSELVSIQYYNLVWLGGTPMETYTHLVYDCKKKSVVTEDDLFDKKGRSAFFALYDKKHRQLYQDTLEAGFRNPKSFEVPKPNGNFYLTANSLVYKLSPVESFYYELGSLTYGFQILEFPYEQIKDWVKEDSPIARIIKAKK